MKSKKIWLILAIAVPVIAGAYLVVRYFKKPAEKDYDTGETKKITPLAASSPSVFPIKVGSRGDLVKQLQTLLGVAVDGIFGPKTQAALTAQTGKISITSQSEFNTVINSLKTAATVNTSTLRADDLIARWKANSSSSLVALQKVDAIEVRQDAYGALTPTGNVLHLTPGLNYNHQDYVLISSTTQGFVKFQVTKGTLAGLYKVDPAKVSIS